MFCIILKPKNHTELLQFYKTVLQVLFIIFVFLLFVLSKLYVLLDDVLTTSTISPVAKKFHTIFVIVRDKIVVL